jgi:hypothetical protein
MILQILKSTKHRPSILFCEEEENGGVGSEKFCKTEFINDLREMKFLIELDRANANDLVFYDNDNTEWHKWCEKVTGYKTAYGSFSDISVLSPNCDISSVNISCGYYYQHTLREFVVYEEMMSSIDAVICMLDEGILDTTPQFKYVEYVYPYNSFKYGYYGNDYEPWYKYDSVSYGCINLYVEYEVINEDGSKTTKNDTICGETEEQCWMNFFLSNSSVCFDNVLDYDIF